MKELGSIDLNLKDIEQIVYKNTPVSIADHCFIKIDKIYNTLLEYAHTEKPIYGINTGFGALAEKRITPAHQALLQRNIILSHAVGVGEALDFYISKTLILLRLNTLTKGHSGASPELIAHLTSLLNSNCAPLVPKKGSVGASGDLAPLAHLGLLLLGIDDAFINEKRVTAISALKRAALKPLTLGLRDGLALINGTQAMTSVAAIALLAADDLSLIADINAACSLDALGGHKSPFDQRIHQVKPHAGQIKTAKNIENILGGRSIDSDVKNQRTQDSYSLRCVPQVHGATKDIIDYVKNLTEIEINSVTDNPLIFIENNHIDILSGGNFHGQHIALAMDYLAMGIAELANIAERRLELLLNPHHSNGLPPFLIDNSGLNSGYMMLHVTATSLVNENKVLCHPASIDSIPTSANREDHVSMGMTSANKLLQVVANTKTVLAIESLAAHQALDFRPGNHRAPYVRKLHLALRDWVPFRKQDGLYKDDLTNILAWFNLDETKQLFKEIIKE